MSDAGTAGPRGGALRGPGALAMSVGALCPEAARLAAFCRDALSPQTAATVERHLAACRPCRERYSELGRGALGPDIPECFVVKELGRGRFGVVYRAWWLTRPPRLVALKVLASAGRMEASRFEREIAVLKRIDSPGIVKCLASGRAGSCHYYLMELVDGRHLDKYLASHTSNVLERLGVLERVCRAVADAHAQGVVHRDLKPRNILIDDAGQPHILDFGICMLEPDAGRTWAQCTITQPGDVIGTLKYMSPEQAWGGAAGPIDFRSDVWALGVMLHDIVTGGAYPYSLKSTADKPVHEALLERIRKELPRLPRLDGLPRGRDLETLLERCLAWEPDRRIESVAALAEDLGRYGRGERIRTRPLGWGYRIRRVAVGAAARSRWMFSAGLVALAGVALWVSALLLGIAWCVTGRDYYGGGGASARAGDTHDARDGIAIVGVSDDTVGAVVGFASAHGLGGVTADMKSWRGVHGHVMERLARAGPKAVVWDYYFRTPQPGDARFVAGVRALERRGVPVVLAAAAYGDDGTPELSPTIRAGLAGGLRYGGIVARDMVRRPAEFVLAIRRADGRVIPSLSLTALAAVLHPDAGLDVAWRRRRTRMELLYRLAPGSYRRERDAVDFTKAFKAGRTRLAVRAGDMLACTTFVLDRPERWRARTLAYEALLSCSDDALRSLVGGRVLIVGDVRKARWGFRADRHRVKYGARIVDGVPGCYLMADAVAGLLDRRYMRSAFPLQPETFLVMMVLAAVGCLLPIKLAATPALDRRAARRVVWCGLLGGAGVCFVVMTVATTWTGVHAGMAGFALLAPMAGAFWVEFARNRHRILDSSRRALLSLASAADGTVTLAPRRRRSPKAAR